MARLRREYWITLITAVGVLAATSQAAQPETPLLSGAEAAIGAIAEAIIKRCPGSDAAKDVIARDACADALGKSKELANATPAESIPWGGTTNASFNPATDKLTQLDALVWRKLYLSLFSFSGYQLETLPNGDKLLRLDAKIRPIAPEEFPYPFWHTAAKWQDYHQSKQVGLLFRGDVLIAAYRNAKLDPTIVFTPKARDGNWTWDVNGQQGTRVSLYTYLLSPRNPNRAALETAYRSFEAASRPYLCSNCHNPGNPSNMNPLMFFTHPSQALVARHAIVKELEADAMPPNVGIKNDQSREALIVLARQFADEGDKALAFEQAQVKSDK